MRGTTWVLALGLWSEQEDTGDATYARIVFEANGWDIHAGTSPFDVALNCFRSLISGATTRHNHLTVKFRYRTKRRDAWYNTHKSVTKEETVGQIDGWIIRYQEGPYDFAPAGTFFLDARGQAYSHPGITEISPETALCAIHYQNSYAEAAGSSRKDIAGARSRLTDWVTAVATGHADPLRVFHCDRCAEAAAMKVARIALGLR